jgi:hypothetical protein
MTLSRFAVAAVLFAGAAGLGVAQPPGPGRGDPEKRDAPRKDGKRKEADRPNLERELQQLRNRANEIEEQLKRSREGGAGREEPKRDGPPFGPRGPMGPRPGFGGPMGFGPGGGFPFDRMEPEQLKELITRLQKTLDDKTRGGDQPKKPGGDQPKKPGGDQPKKASPEDVLKRLDQINRELEELRRSLGK